MDWIRDIVPHFPPSDDGASADDLPWYHFTLSVIISVSCSARPRSRAWFGEDDEKIYFDGEDNDNDWREKPTL
jgi:hypothetical protein